MPVLILLVLRVVLADGDPELHRALEASLSPWHVEVVVDTSAAARDRTDARFIVWREGGDLVVVDRETGRTERRPARTGALDPVDAATEALTVKTIMRLDEPPPPPPAPEPALVIEPEVGLAMRAAFGLDTEVSPRLELAVAARLPPGIRVGALVDLGGDSAVARASFQGTWSSWSVFATAAYPIERGHWDLVPWLGVGLERSVLAGSEMTSYRVEQATLFAIRPGVTALYRMGRFRVGALGAIDLLPGTATYTRLGSSAEVFEIPALGVLIGAVIEADIAP